MSLPYNNGYGNQNYHQPNLRLSHQPLSSFLGLGQGQFIPNSGGMAQQINQQLPSISNSIQDYAYPPPPPGIEMNNQSYYQQRGNGPMIQEAPIIYQSNIPLQVEPHMPYQVFNYQNSSMASYPVPYVNGQQYVSYMQTYPGQHLYPRPGLLNKQQHSYDTANSSYEQSSFSLKGPSLSSENLSLATNLEKGLTDGTGHYTPTQTKKNSRPRIHKLNKSDRLSADGTKSQIMLGELSAEELCSHFKEILKIPSSMEGSLKTNLLITNDLEYQLFDLFVTKLSKSLDLFLPQDVYSRVVPEIALQDDTGMVMNTIYCFSSLILQRIKPDVVDLSLTIKYYHQSIKSVRYYLNLPQVSDNDNGYIGRCLLSTVILCIYELFFVAIDSTYIKGAASIFFSILTKNKGNSLLKSSPFYQACFWTMFYCDLVLSIKHTLPMMYAVDEYWFPLEREFFELFLEESLLKRSQEDKVPIPSPDKTRWWMYKSLINFSLVYNFKTQIGVLTREDMKSNQPFYKWLELKAKVDDFQSKMPPFLKPTIYEPSSQSRVFPIVYFKDEATAVTILHLNLAKIILYESLVSRTNTDDPIVQVELSNFPAKYCENLAKDTIGILKTYDCSPILWPGNVHPLRHITSYFTKDPIALKQLEDLVHRFTISCNLRVQGKPLLAC